MVEEEKTSKHKVQSARNCSTHSNPQTAVVQRDADTLIDHCSLVGRCCFSSPVDCSGCVLVTEGWRAGWSKDGWMQMDRGISEGFGLDGCVSGWMD